MSGPCRCGRSVDGRRRGVLEAVEVCLKSGTVTLEGGHLGAQGEYELVGVDGCLDAVVDQSVRIAMVAAVRGWVCCLLLVKWGVAVGSKYRYND